MVTGRTVPAKPSALPLSRASRASCASLSSMSRRGARLVEHEIHAPAPDQRQRRCVRARIDIQQPAPGQLRQHRIDLLGQRGEPLAAQAALRADRPDVAGDARQHPFQPLRFCSGDRLVISACLPGSFSGNPCGSIGIDSRYSCSAARAAAQQFRRVAGIGRDRQRDAAGQRADGRLALRLVEPDARQQQADPRSPRAAVEPGGIDLHRHAPVGGDARQDVGSPIPAPVPARPGRDRRSGRVCRDRAVAPTGTFAACCGAGFAGSCARSAGRAGAWLATSGGRRRTRGRGGPRSCNATPPATIRTAMSSQNHPRPRQPAKNRRGPANTGRSVGDDAVLRRHRLCHHQRLLQLEVRVVRLGRVELREALRRLGGNLLGDRRQVGARRRRRHPACRPGSSARG